MQPNARQTSRSVVNGLVTAGFLVGVGVMGYSRFSESDVATGTDVTPRAASGHVRVAAEKVMDRSTQTNEETSTPAPTSGSSGKVFSY